MRSFSIAMLSALVALVLGASTANASSVDIIWVGSGNSHTTVSSSSATVTGLIIITIGTADTAIGGNPASIELSADYTSNLATIANLNTPPTGWLPLATGPDDGISHFENVVAMFNPFSGAVLAPGSSTTIGTISFHVGPGPGAVIVSASGVGDDINTGGPVSVLGEFTFGAGTISHIPEPTALSLLALGLVGIAAVRRRRAL